MNRKSWEWWAGVARVDCIFGIRNACFCICDATETMAGDKAPTTKKKHIIIKFFFEIMAIENGLPQVKESLLTRAVSGT